MIRVGTVLALIGLALVCVALAMERADGPIAWAAAACIVVALAIALHADAKRRHAPFVYDPRGVAGPELQLPPPREVRPGRSLLVVGLTFGICGVGAFLLSFSSRFSKLERDLLVLASVILLGMMPWLIKMLRRQRAQMLRLARDGVVVVGEVIAGGPAGVPYRFVVDWEEVVGASSFGKRPSVAPKKGDRLVVLYDPADPSQNVAAYSLRDVRFTAGDRRTGSAAAERG